MGRISESEKSDQNSQIRVGFEVKTHGFGFWFWREKFCVLLTFRTKLFKFRNRLEKIPNELVTFWIELPSFCNHLSLLLFLLANSLNFFNIWIIGIFVVILFGLLLFCLDPNPDLNPRILKSESLLIVYPVTWRYYSGQCNCLVHRFSNCIFVKYYSLINILNFILVFIYVYTIYLKF